MSLDHLTGRATRAGRSTQGPPPGLVAATIATTPAGGESVDVLIGGDANQRTGPSVWTPIVVDGEMFTPARDDPCFVVQARKGEMVVVWWEPGDDRAGVAIDTAPSAERLAQPGDVKWTARTTAPDGWLAADGSAVSRTTYADLFAAIGTTHGAGNGSTTFNLPDGRGRAPVGAGTGTGLTARTVGQTFGVEDHALTVAQMPAHAHGDLAIAGTGAKVMMDGAAGAAARNLAYTITAAGNPLGVPSQGGGGTHPNVQPSLCLLAVIKT